MPEEKREPPPDQEVQEILGDLDAILSDLGGAPGAAASLEAAVPPATPRAAAPTPAPVPAPPPAAAKPPAPAPAPAPPPQLKPAPVLAPPPAAPPKPPSLPPPPAPPGEISIELGTRALPAAKPPEKKPAPPAQPAATKPPLELDLGGAKAVPAPVPPAAFAPPPAPMPAPAAPARPVQKGTPPPDPLPDIPAPDKLGKDQIRRVAFIYLVKYEAERDALAKLLDQTAQTVPKKPLFLRRVLYQPVTEESSAAELLARIQQAKAVAVLGIVEGISEPRLREWTEALAGAGLIFRVIGPLEAGKRSVAIEVVVDAILLPPEAA
ncbi:MAG: hypothetical protein HY926_16260 [Elusimicrobia bacterium]|nr:hypothetical protein [Elusimicrobiota bacterium]